MFIGLGRMELMFSGKMNRIRTRFCFLLVLLFSCFSSYAQEKCSILGYVHEFVKTPLSNDNVSAAVTSFEAILITKQDTLSTFSKNGDFIFRDLDPGTVKLHIVKEGYIPFESDITLTEGDQAVTVELFHEGETLENAVVTANQPVLTMSGDTLVFHADAVRRMRGDFAIDLIAQMPGAEISDLGIKVGGKDVRRAYVNGVLVFGRDPMDAMRNLAAEEVIAMNIYDEDPLGTNELELQAHQKERVINIKTKNPIVDVTDIQVLLSGGADKAKDIDGKIQKRYIAGLSGNFFSEDLQIKTDILTNNLGIEKSIALGSDAFSTPASALTSHSVKSSLGLRVEKYWGKNYNTRTGLFVGYSFSDNYGKTPQKSIVEHFKTNLSPARKVTDSTLAITTMKSHNLDAGFQKNIGNARLTWTNRISILENGSSTEVMRENRVSDESYGENSSRGTDNDTWKIDENLSLRGRTKRGDSPYTLSLSFGADKGNNLGYNIDTLQSSASRRYLEMSGDNLSWNAGLNYSLTKYFKNGKPYSTYLKMQASTEYRNDSKKQTSLDLLGGTPSIDSFNSFDFTYSALTSKAGLVFSTLYFNGGLSVWHSYLVDNERIPAPEQKVSKSYLSLVPSLFLYNGRTINFNLNSGVLLPSMEQVRKRINNTNPYSVIAGNPDLTPGRTYTMSFSKRAQGMNMRDITLQTTFTHHPIVRREKYFLTSTILPEYDGYEMPAGSMLHYYENADWAINANLKYQDSKVLDSRSLKTKPFGFSYRMSVGAAVNPAYLVDELYRTTDFTTNGSANINYTPNERIRFSLQGAVGYSKSSSSISEKVIDAANWNYGLVVKYNPVRLAFMETSFNNSSKLIVGEGTVWSHNFLKLSIGANLMGQRLKLMVEGIDMLNNQSMYSTSVSENSFSQYFNPVFGQYFLISLKYRFNSTQERFFMSSFDTEIK